MSLISLASVGYVNLSDSLRLREGASASRQCQITCHQCSSNAVYLSDNRLMQVNMLGYGKGMLLSPQVAAQ